MIVREKADMRTIITKPRIPKICAAALVLFLTTPSHAGFFTGYKLVELLSANARFMSGRGMAGDGDLSLQLSGFIAGVSDASDGDLFCIPVAATVGQEIAFVKKFVDENPEKWNIPASLLVQVALRKAFPCPK